MNLLKKILPRDSFYLILFICVSVVGASAVWVSKEKTSTPDRLEAREEFIEEEIALDLKEINVKRKPSQKKKEETTEIVKEVKKEEAKTKPDLNPNPVEEKIKIEEVEKADRSQEVSASQVEVKVLKLKRPVEGSIYKDFANDKLLYSKTLDEWATHLGIDIRSAEGTDVLAAQDGIVKSIESDERLGITIVIDHGNSLETVYKNISTAKLVKIGQKVKMGTVISKVSKGIGFEKLDEPHLHFEVIQSGIRVDPKSFF